MTPTRVGICVVVFFFLLFALIHPDSFRPEPPPRRPGPPPPPRAQPYEPYLQPFDGPQDIPEDVRTFPAFLAHISDQGYFDDTPTGSREYDRRMRSAASHWRRLESGVGVVEPSVSKLSLTDYLSRVDHARTDAPLTEEKRHERALEFESTLQTHLNQHRVDTKRQLTLLGGNSRSVAGRLSSYSCSWRFTHYESSAWESAWYSDAMLPGDFGFCQKLLTPPELEKSICLIARIREFMTNINTATKIPKAQGPPYQETTTTTTPLNQDTTTPQRIKLGSEEYMRDVASALFSRMHYELVCRPGSGHSESTSSSSSSSSSSSGEFIVGRGYDLIEPLVGILRDPLSMCHPHPTATSVAEHLRPFYKDIGFDAMIQSKEFLLLQVATPYHVELASPNAYPAWAQAIDLPRRIGDTLEITTRGSGGMAPWLFRMGTSHSPNNLTSTWPFISQPKRPSYVTRHRLTPRGELDTIVDDFSEEERATSLLVDPSNGDIDIPYSLTPSGSRFWNPSNLRRGSNEPRVILFDLGASYFGHWGADTTAIGSSWFYRILKSKGLHIDRVYAWEYATLDPNKEWSMIPSDLYSGFTFINTGVTADPTQTTNPWNTLMKVARPIDHVIIKLDIDTSSIEIPLMEQLMTHPELQQLVDEMFFEHHTKVREMDVRRTHTHTHERAHGSDIDSDDFTPSVPHVCVQSECNR